METTESMESSLASLANLPTASWITFGFPQFPQALLLDTPFLDCFLRAKSGWVRRRGYLITTSLTTTSLGSQEFSTQQ